MESPTEGHDRNLLINNNNQHHQFLGNGEVSPGIYYYNRTPSTPNPSRKVTAPNRSLEHRGLRKRAIYKNGDCNILHKRMATKGLRFMLDIFTTLVDIQWRWTLTIFALAFFVCWLAFALIWWLIVFTHGDLEEEHLPPRQGDSKWTPCILNIYNFTSCYLYSLETQHTIGYGVRTITEECPEAIFVMGIQCIAGLMIQAFMVGIVFAKMTRPKFRTQTLLFSRCAVISQRDGLLCLMFRVGDMRKTHLVGASVRALLIKPRRTKEGDILGSYQTELSVSADGSDGNLFFIWPMTIIHKINEDSPLFRLSADDLLHDRFEIVVALEGTVESTGQTTQARSSYVSNEILWGHRFESIISYNKERQGYEVNYSTFNNTYPVDTPLCSAEELGEINKLQHESEDEERNLDEKMPLIEEGILRPPPPPTTNSRNQDQQFHRRIPFPDYPETYDESTLLEFNSSYV